MRKLKKSLRNKRLKRINRTTTNTDQLAAIERHYHKHEYPKVQKALQEFRKEHVSELKEKRIPVLKELITANQTLVRVCESRLNNINIPYLQREAIKKTRDGLLKWISKYRTEIREIRSYEQSYTNNENMDLKVEAARKFQISNLIEFNSHNKAHCISPDHYDEHPSMHYYPDTNEVHCFSCGYHQDAIGVYQMLNSCGFKETVLKLGGSNAGI